MRNKYYIIMEDTGKVFNMQTGQFDCIKAHDDRALFWDRNTADDTQANLKAAGHECLVCTVMVGEGA